MVAAVALVDPQIAEKPAQAPMVAMASPPGNSADELVGRVEKPAADSGMKRQLAHENEEGNDRQVICGENRKHVIGDEVQCRVGRNDNAETDETDDSHEKAHGHPREDECNEGNQPD